MPVGTRVAWGDDDREYVVWSLHDKSGWRWITREGIDRAIPAKMTSLRVIGPPVATTVAPPPSPAPLPVKPYAGTSGWSGTDTSRERAVRADKSGVTTERQRLVLRYVSASYERGVTVVEARRDLQLHHGQASGALSNLHRGGHLALLTERRDRCHVYVLVENVRGRDTIPPRTNARALTDDEKHLIRVALLGSDVDGARDLALDETW
jgi:hypothetical protein